MAKSKRFTKHFLIYGLSKRSLNVNDHNALNQLIYAQLLSKVQFVFSINEIKVAHFMEHYATLLSYNNQLSEWLENQVNLVINIGSFVSSVYRYGHFSFCKRCCGFGHVAEDCVAAVGAIRCFRCGDNHDFGVCVRNAKKCFMRYSNANLRSFSFNHQYGDVTCLTIINYCKFLYLRAN